jgi:3-oxoacyl-(acyl-carrier-protein) synthase
MDKILFDIAPDVKRHGGGAIVEMLLILARVSIRTYGSLCASGDGAIDDAWHAIRMRQAARAGHCG